MKASSRAGVAPDGGWGWLVVLGCALVHMMLTGLSRSFGVFYVVLLDRYGATDAATSIIICLFNFFRLMLGPLASMLCERFGSRRVVMLGGLIIFAGCITCSFANSIFYMYLSFGVLTGIGSCLAFTPSLITVGKYFDKNKGKAMSLSTLGNGLGAFSLAPLINLLLKTYGYRGAWWVISAMMLHVCVAGALYRPLHKLTLSVGDQDAGAALDVSQDKKENPSTQNDVEESALTDTNKTEGKLEDIEVTVQPQQKTPRCAALRQQCKALKNVTFLAYGLAMMAMPVLNSTFLMMLPALAKSRGFSDTQGALLVSMSGVADCVGRFGFGLLFDMKSVRGRRMHVHVLTGIIPGALAACLPFLTNYGALMTIVCVYGFIFSGFNGQRITVLSNYMPTELLPSATGFLVFYQGFGHSYGLILSGHLKDRFGNYNVCYHFAGSFMVGCTLIYWTVMTFMRMRTRNRQSNT